MHEKQVRLSVANLVTYISLANGYQGFVIRNPKDANKPWQSLSAGPKLSDMARSFFGDHFLAHDFHDTDLRFKLPESQVQGVVDYLEVDAVKEAPLVDWNPRQELFERLVFNYWEGVSEFISKQSFFELEFIIHRSLTRQPDLNEGEEQGGQGSTVRYFQFWTIFLPNEDLFDQFRNSQVIRFVEREELLSTQGGRCIGTLGDGSKLANNVGVDIRLE